MLEKRFGAPGQLVALSGEFVAFPPDYCRDSKRG